MFQYTKAHLALARDIMLGHTPGCSAEAVGIRNAAQLIADSEARAVAEVVNALTCTHHNDKQRAACPVCLVTTLTAERDQLRAKVKSCGELSCDECNARTARLTAERDKLRAEVEKVYALVTPVGCDLGGGIFETAQAVTELRAERDQLRVDLELADVMYQRECEVEHELRTEVERLRSDRDCEKRLRKDSEEFRENAIARAERAEDNLAALEHCHDDNCRGVVKIAAELDTAKERLRSEAMDDYAAIKDLQRELATERAIVSRIWTQLGSPTHAQLKGRSIYDLIDELKADYDLIDELKVELATERGKLDWVFENCKVEANDYTTGNRDVYYVHDREDLGVAMKEDAK